MTKKEGAPHLPTLAWLGHRYSDNFSHGCILKRTLSWFGHGSGKRLLSDIRVNNYSLGMDALILYVYCLRTEPVLLVKIV